MGDDVKEQEQVQNLVTVDHVSVKAPAFYTKSPEAWFRRMESQFVLANITNSKTKYHHIMSALPEDIAMNIITDDGEDYDALKDAVLKSLRANKHELIEKALSSIELEDRRPSQLLIEIKRRFAEIGLTPDDTIIKSRLLKAMPPSVRTALVGHAEVSVDQYAQIADSIMAVASFRPEPTNYLAAVSQEDRRESARSYDRREPTRYSDRRSTFSSSVKPFYDGQRPKMCNAHIFFGRHANSCRDRKSVV